MRYNQGSHVRILFFLVLFAGTAWSQPAQLHPACGNKLFVQETYEYMKPQRSLMGHDFFEFTPRTIPVIWVVVHIVWKDESGNIGDDQVYDQIDALNRDFNGDNADITRVPDEFRSVMAGSGIQFCLAPVSPEGSPVTGIIRRQTSVEGIGTADALFSTQMGGSDPWDTHTYFNIWIADTGDQVTGYGIYPESADSIRDGIVVNPKYFGMEHDSEPYHLGRVAVHETGHYLGLRHVWGDDEDCNTDDGIEDTPAQQFPYYGCPDYPKHSCHESNMFMNFMDYVDDDCMHFFTQGQMSVMLENLQQYRPGIWAHPAPCETGIAKNKTDFKVYPNPSSGSLTIDASYSAKSLYLNCKVYSAQGSLVEQFSTYTSREIDLDLNSPGMYFIKIEDDVSGTQEVVKFIFIQ